MILWVLRVRPPIHPYRLRNEMISQYRVSIYYKLQITNQKNDAMLHRCYILINKKNALCVRQYIGRLVSVGIGGKRSPMRI